MIGFYEAGHLVIFDEQHLIKLDNPIRAGKLLGEIILKSDIVAELIFNGCGNITVHIDHIGNSLKALESTIGQA
jgi:hypothetical protein